MLERAGSQSMEYEGRRVSGKRLVAILLWQLAKTGKATMPNGRVLEVDHKDWFDVVKFIYQHIDGPPKAELDVTTGGEQLIIQYVNDWRDQATIPASGTDSDKDAG